MLEPVVRNCRDELLFRFSSSGSVTVEFNKNYPGVRRQGHVVINNLHWYYDPPVDQCIGAVSVAPPLNVPVPNSGSVNTVNIQVTAPADCGWDVETLYNPDMFSYDTTENWAGTRPLTTYVQNNTQLETRQGRIRIGRRAGFAGIEVTLTQPGILGPDPGGDVSYFYTDALGSVRAITNAARRPAGDVQLPAVRCTGDEHRQHDDAVAVHRPGAGRGDEVRRVAGVRLLPRAVLSESDWQVHAA